MAGPARLRSCPSTRSGPGSRRCSTAGARPSRPRTGSAPPCWCCSSTGAACRRWSSARRRRTSRTTRASSRSRAASSSARTDPSSRRRCARPGRRSGSSRAAVEVLGLFDDVPTTVTNFVITPVLGLARGEPIFRPDGREIERVIEIPLAASPPAGRVSRGAVGAGGRPAARRLRELRRGRGLGHHGAHPPRAPRRALPGDAGGPGRRHELRDAARRRPGRRGAPSRSIAPRRATRSTRR